MDSINLLIWDLSELIKITSYRDFTWVIPFAWVLILSLIPLRFVDRRHAVTFATFSSVYIAIGLSILIPIHSMIETKPRSATFIWLSSICLLLISFYKWSLLSPLLYYGNKEDKSVR